MTTKVETNRNKQRSNAVANAESDAKVRSSSLSLFNFYHFFTNTLLNNHRLIQPDAVADAIADASTNTVNTKQQENALCNNVNSETITALQRLNQHRNQHKQN
jgi:hypothetical protein